MLLYDIRYGLRVLLRSPGFTAIALTTIAVGTGANTAVFGFVSALLYRPAPGIAKPGSLVAVYTSDFSSGPHGATSYPDFVDLKTQATAFSDVAAHEDGQTGVVRTNDRVERVRVSTVSGDYFDLLGVHPRAGRLLSQTDTDLSAAPVAVLGYRLWQRLFDESTAAVGETFSLNGRPFTLVGVASEEFEGLDLGRAVDVWIPLLPRPLTVEERSSRGLSIVARLRTGASLEAAQVEVSAIAARLAAAYPESNLGTLAAPGAARPMIVLRLTRLPPEFRGMVAMVSAVLMFAVGLVLLIACANIGALLISRATARAPEMAIRFALGASRRELVRQLLTESLILGLAGGGLGLLLSLWTADVLPSFFPAEQARMLETGPDTRSLLFILGISVLSSMAFGLAPALFGARPSAGWSVTAANRRVSDSRGGIRLRRVLVAGQVAMAVVLLVCAALLVQSLSNAVRADMGFATRDGVVASVELPTAEFSSDEGLSYYEAVVARVERLPGVVDAAFARTLPLNRMSRRGFSLEGYEHRSGEDREVRVNVVGRGYFSALQIPLLAGRTFDARDDGSGVPVVIVNDRLARQYFGGNAVGKRVTDSMGHRMEIVGVVQSMSNLTPQDPPVATVYYPVTQHFDNRLSLIVRTATDPRLVTSVVRREVQAVSQAVPVFRTITLASHLSEATAAERLTATLVGISGALALLLAAVGVYSVIAYGVVRRRREIGVRVALGARPMHVLKLVMAEGLGVTALGLALGLVGAAIASAALGSLLYGVSASDPVTFVLVPASLALIAFAAAWLPARRALRLEPSVVLRQD